MVDKMRRDKLRILKVAAKWEERARNVSPDYVF
jgi:hypothetical protein